MTDVSHAEGIIRERSRKSELWEFRALVAAAYPLFLTATAVGRLTGATAGRPAGGRRSIFAEAHATATATLACAFMG